MILIPDTYGPLFEIQSEIFGHTEVEQVIQKQLQSPWPCLVGPRKEHVCSRVSGRGRQETAMVGSTCQVGITRSAPGHGTPNSAWKERSGWWAGAEGSTCLMKS